MAHRGALCSMFFLFALGCSGNDPAVGDCGVVFDTYLKGRNPPTGRELTRLQIDTQYRIYICAQQYVHPPRMGYGVDELASQGEEAARFLTQKLRESEYEFTTVNLMPVFLRMHQTGSYDLAADEELMMLLRQKVSAIRNETYRRIAEEDIDEIMNVTSATKR